MNDNYEARKKFVIKKEKEIVGVNIDLLGNRLERVNYMCGDLGLCNIYELMYFDSFGSHLLPKWMKEHYLKSWYSLNHQNKYIPVKDRPGCLDDRGDEILKAVMKTVERYQYKLSMSASDLGHDVRRILQDVIERPDYQKKYEENKVLNAHTIDWLGKFLRAMEKANIDVLTGVEKDPVGRYRKIKETKWWESSQ